MRSTTGRATSRFACIQTGRARRAVIFLLAAALVCHCLPVFPAGSRAEAAFCPAQAAANPAEAAPPLAKAAAALAALGARADILPSSPLPAPLAPLAPLAMGGRDEEALGARNAGQEETAVERLFGGSFLGALLFGYPYTGLGGADMAALALLALLFFRLATARSRDKRDEGRFTVHTRDESSTHVSRDRDLPGRNRHGEAPHAPSPGPENGPENSWENGPENGRENGPVGGGRERTPASANDPRDNAWTRRMGGPSAKSPEDSPWRRGSGSAPQAPPPQVTVKKRAEAMWGHLRSEGPQNTEQYPASRPPASQASLSEDAVAQGARVPRGFDVADFLEGARALYARLQELWARREISGLEGFLTPDMMALLQKQAEKHPDPVPVDVLLVEATLKDVDDSAGGESASVLFKALIRTGGADQPSEVREEWLFRRGEDSNGMWRLAGIKGA